MLACIISIFWFCGILKMIELFYRFVWMIRRNLRTTDHLPVRYGKASWAVITGASNDLGLEMAKELARLNFNIVLIDTNESKVKSSLKQLQVNYP